MTLDYFYGQAGELFSFYRIPKALFQENTVSRPVNRCQNTLWHPARPHEPVREKRLAGRAEPGVHPLHDRGCQEGIVLRRQQSDQAAAELEKFGLIERKRRGQGKPSLVYVKNFFGRIFKRECQES